jgi:hypothetical protein
MSSVTIQIEKAYPAQQRIIDEALRFNVLQCGRRVGKTTLGVMVAIDPALDGHPVGYFAPTYKTMSEVYRQMLKILKPVIESASKTDQQIRLITGGVIDFWTLQDEDAGRSRKYKRIIIDEGSVVRNLMRVWQESIRPTLTDLRGDAWFLGTPKGRRDFHVLYSKGVSGAKGWKSWRLETADNPYIHPEEIEEARRDLPKAIFDQEYRGIPADDGGNPFGITAIHACINTDIIPGPAITYAADLAKSMDWTVIGGFDENNHLVEVQRWQGPWEETITRIARIIGDKPALLDATGVGDPIVERLQKMGHAVEGFKFTQQSKQEIMLGLAVAIQNGDITLPDERWLISELESFGYEYTRTGVRYEAPQGLHDDGVCMLAMANKHRIHGQARSIHIGSIDYGDFAA